MTAGRFAVILPAAGLSTRFGRNKLHEPLLGKSVLLRSIEAFLDRPDTDRVVLATTPGVVAESYLPADVVERLKTTDRVLLVEGGASRAESVRNAMLNLLYNVEFVAVHDAARPLVSRELIDRVYAHATAHGSAVPAMPVKLTIKQAAGPLPAAVQRTLPRAELWEMQTPQVMRRTDLLTAFERCQAPMASITDDAQVMELAGFPVWLVPGEERNLKLTTAADLILAKQFLTGPA